MRFLPSIIVAVFALSLFAERQPYERYQSIVDRQMFGAPPPGFDPTVPPSEVSKSDAAADEEQLTKEQEQIKSAIHFSVINVTPNGETAVGFTDNGDSKNPVHYYLKVGESRNGWLVKEADPVKATMTIAKGAVEVSLSIGGNSAKQSAADKDGASSARRPVMAFRDGIAPGSLRGRRMMRERQREAVAAEEAKRIAEEKARREEDKRIEEEEKAQRAAELAEQREQLLQIQEELRKQRESGNLGKSNDDDNDSGEE